MSSRYMTATNCKMPVKKDGKTLLSSRLDHNQIYKMYQLIT